MFNFNFNKQDILEFIGEVIAMVSFCVVFYITYIAAWVFQ